MGRDLAEASPAARAVFAEADEVLGFPLSELCWNGPEEELQLTANAQPAILAASLSAWRAFEERSGARPAMVAGHSLGEYSALVAAGTLALGDALALVRRRGELMQEAVPAGEGAMAAILGLGADEVEAAAVDAREGLVCSVANLNAPEQTVIAGHRAAVERAVELAKARGARRAILLAVSAPFHCSLMAPARERLLPHLEATRFADPEVPVVCNVDAAPVTDGAAARQALARQVDAPVRWVESVRWMAGEGGVETFLEVGPGNVLAGLVRRIAKDAGAASLGAPGDLDALLGGAEEGG